MTRKDERIRVMRVIARLNVGGPARHVAALAELDDHGFETLLVHGAPQGEEADMADLVHSTGVRHATISDLGRRVSWNSDGRALLRIRAAYRAFRPHIVHTHTAKAGTLGRLAAMLDLPRRRSRTVHTFHGHVFHSYFGPWLSRAVRGTERTLARFTDRIVVISERQRAEIVDRFKIAAPAQVVVVPLGLDLEPFTQSERPAIIPGIDSAAPVIGIVGRLVPVKNHDLFLAAADLLHETHPHVQFAIVGGGDDEARLRKQVQDRGIADTVHFVGWRRDMPAIYGACDIVALTSRNEGTPVTLIEAMASAKAVTATDVGGVRDVVQPGTGLLVHPGDAAALAAAWRTLLDRPELRASYGEAGRVSVLSRYSKRRLIADVAALYRELHMPSARP